MQMSVLLAGYIAAVFDVQDAFLYWNFFLDHTEDSHPRAYYYPGSGSMAIAYPKASSSQHPIILDYRIIRPGSVVPAVYRRFMHPQRVALKQTSPAGPNPSLPRLYPPVFFHNLRTGQPGIPLSAAFNGSALQEMANLDQIVRISDKQFVVFEVDWPGYDVGFEKQLNLKGQQSGPTMRWAIERALDVANAFFDKYNGRPSTLAAWTLGYGNNPYVITRERVLVIGLLHVSAGKWRPILQLDNIIVSPH
ncbi:unnamed protein product [Peniophora sp. CBMAI 1063]|nr:unnamed protein product [Peniophora sp. CBMAI 1063]